ncbi:SDR family oxidoreductase [Halorhodospira halophila]|uniref:Short-chain dehydrogenase/reductase SDR n=1 Tax=Halorhodospira halophila (strain DSM 244 / SL1) TaxID=349124 RepID=A1WXA3_HALHL|nr:SDR family oxidoreductase [Halorhodospira halophila]ABM62315.1 short-chain dehydrogenase/reductase SDR [Halorhodospira halophila SL1]MBK1730084.1 short-chain dehydrogenase [Halorhodospira halophila]
MSRPRIVIFGATSAITQALARHYAESGAALTLLGRNEERLQEVAADLRARGAADTTILRFDADDPQQLTAVVDRCWRESAPVDLAIIGYGTLPDQAACEREPDQAAQALATNGVSVIVLLLALARHFEGQDHGSIAVFSSVARDRGRPSNAVYGAAKGAVSIFLSGLRARLHKSGVHVLTIKPGFVDTPMTQGLALPRVLLTTPERVAADLRKAIQRRRSTLYTPWFWRWILLIIRSIPEPLFKRLSL